MMKRANIMMLPPHGRIVDTSYIPLAGDVLNEQHACYCCTAWPSRLAVSACANA
jgi:hypothetical protein